MASEQMTMTLSVPRQAFNFARHFLEMCVAMCVVGTPIVLILTRALPAGPEIELVLVGAVYTAPMVGWMRWRGMAWPPVLEMAIATFVLGPVVFVLESLGVLPDGTVGELASSSYCLPACALMFIVMLPRLSTYTGRTGHHH